MASNIIPKALSPRLSNIELLRIVLMFYIVIYHFCLDLLRLFPESKILIFAEVFFHIGVPLFILISGYFSITLHLRKIIHFYLYCVFWFFLCLIISHIYTGETITSKDIVIQFFPFSNTQGCWFIPYYLLLMLISPILNLVKDKCSGKQHLSMLIILITFLFYSGLIARNGDTGAIVNNGHSIIYFITIYITGSYIKRISVSMSHFRARSFIKFYIIAVFISAVIIAAVPSELNFIITRLLFLYQSPMLLVTSIIFFLLFLSMPFYSKYINYMATSSFAIYLFHENNHIVPIWSKALETIMKNYPLWVSVNLVVLLAISLLVFAIVIDKIFREPISKNIEPPIYALCKLAFESLKKNKFVIKLCEISDKH